MSKKIKIKPEIVAQIAEQSGYTKTTTKAILDMTLSVITSALAEGYDVSFKDFGVFKVKHCKERKGRNPKTGEKIQVPAKKVPSFKAGKGLKEAVN